MMKRIYYLQVETQLNMLKVEMDGFIHRCAVDSKKMVDDVDMEAHNLDIVEREAAEILEVRPVLYFLSISLSYGAF